MYESADILVLAVIAGFIIYKLYNILGQGGEEFLAQNKNYKIVNIIPTDIEEKEQKIDIKQLKILDLSPEIRKVITQIMLIDQEFNENKFLNSAIKVFEIIMSAYSDADTLLLKKLLSTEVYEDFLREIDLIKLKNEKLENIIVKIVKTDFVDVRLIDNTALISINFESEQIRLVRNKENEIIRGDPSEIETISEIWTFSRNLISQDPNWKLISTKSL